MNAGEGCNDIPDRELLSFAEETLLKIRLEIRDRAGIRATEGIQEAENYANDHTDNEEQ